MDDCTLKTFTTAYLRQAYGLNRNNELWNTGCPIHARKLRELYVVLFWSSFMIAEYCSEVLGASVSRQSVDGWLVAIGVEIRSKSSAQRASVLLGRTDMHKARAALTKKMATGWHPNSVMPARTMKSKMSRMRKSLDVWRRDRRVKKICRVCASPFTVCPSMANSYTNCENCRGVYRRPEGPSHPNAKLDEWDVFDIRTLCLRYTKRSLAARFGVSLGCIKHIINGDTWRHLTVPATPRPDVPADAIKRNPELAAYLGITPEQMQGGANA